MLQSTTNTNKTIIPTPSPSEHLGKPHKKDSSLMTRPLREREGKDWAIEEIITFSNTKKSFEEHFARWGEG